MKLFGPAPLSLEQRRPVDVALDDAFAPLRARTVNLGPARVRAAVRWTAPEPPQLQGLALLTRVSELTLAAAICAFLFAGSAASLVAAPAVPDMTRDAATSTTRVLNGRLAYQPPIDPHPTDFRSTVGHGAANAALARRPEEAAQASTVRDSEPFAGAP